MTHQSYIDTQAKDRIKELNDKKKNTKDAHERYRIEEQKLLQGLFSPELTNYSRYRSPW